MMNTTQDKIANPLNYYSSPSKVAQDVTLTQEDKIKILTNWLNDITLQQIAEEENMLATPETNNQQVVTIERLLRKYQHKRLH